MPYFSRTFSSAVLTVAATTAGAALGQSASGPELQVNTFTQGSQVTPVVAMNDGGAFVVVWQSNSQDGASGGIFAQRFNAVGVRQAAEFQVNTHTASSQEAPTAAMDGEGRFVVAWQSLEQDGSQNGIFARRFDAAGAPLGGEFQVSTYTYLGQIDPGLGMDGDGDFVIAWASLRDGAGFGIFARRFDSTGVGQAIEFQVNVLTASNPEGGASVGMSDDGEFVVVWQSYPQDGSQYGIFGRRYDSAGTAQGSAFQVNTHTPYAQSHPAVAMDADGDFVVAWKSTMQDNSGNGVFGRRFDGAGVPQAIEFQVSSFTSGQQEYPTVGMHDDGEFVMVWQSNGQNASYGVFGELTDSTGTEQGSEFQIHSYAVGEQIRPSVGVGGNGAFVVAWSSPQDGDLTGIFAQRFSPLATLDVDGDGTVLAVTDGLLVLRRAFGFDGTTLTANAVGLECTRCDAAAIVPYLTGLDLDIDDDGSVQALTDGLLVLRFEFGFTGSALTSNAVDNGCERCTDEEILMFLQDL